MTTATEKKTDTMQAAEFQAQVGADHTIRLPDELAARVPAGKDLRVLLLWPDPVVPYEFGTDEEWAQLGAHEMARTADDEWNNDDLLKG